MTKCVNCSKEYATVGILALHNKKCKIDMDYLSKEEEEEIDMLLKQHIYGDYYTIYLNKYLGNDWRIQFTHGNWRVGFNTKKIYVPRHVMELELIKTVEALLMHIKHALKRIEGSDDKIIEINEIIHQHWREFHKREVERGRVF